MATVGDVKAIRASSTAEKNVFQLHPPLASSFLRSLLTTGPAMPKNALVTLRYGPYRSCGVVEHRTFRLEGLQAVLKADGHQIVLEEIPDWNDVQLIVNGETIFQCNINDLDFVASISVPLDGCSH
ncbi:UPF0728 protein C10orf53 homolog isoform X2 [Crotalus tigris]|uniref:UPF0728 protein C10orf53 homolog isoform X2 n=1 Tax=Crotalus tigris TaxID=88082 RepID=UPI00192F885B|nr:UPF0728 protein C10orf53 homolog isoform X2 [Crotalus tigris]